jgi:hypothetical protein
VPFIARQGSAYVFTRRHLTVSCPVRIHQKTPYYILSGTYSPEDTSLDRVRYVFTRKHLTGSCPVRIHKKTSHLIVSGTYSPEDTSLDRVRYVFTRRHLTWSCPVRMHRKTPQFIVPGTICIGARCHVTFFHAPKRNVKFVPSQELGLPGRYVGRLRAWPVGVRFLAGPRARYRGPLSFLAVESRSGGKMTPCPTVVCCWDEK